MSEISEVDSNTILITSQKNESKAFEEAMYNFESKSNLWSVQFNDLGNGSNYKIEDIDTLASGLQNNLYNIINVNNTVRLFVNKDDILGKVYEAIETNINSQWELNFSNAIQDDQEKFKFVENLIKEFNNKIDLDRIIVESIPMTYLEGNYIMYLREQETNGEINYKVDYYPLGIAEISDYTEGGEPYVLLNVNELRTRLNKIYKKDKKNQPLFYKNIDEEVKETMPIEVVKAFNKKEFYAKLNIEKTGVMRINNMKRKYGVTPIFKSLKPVIRLENIELSDDKNTLVRGKKIIFQELHKELLTSAKDIKITWLNAQAKAHNDLMSALKSSGTSVYSGTPWVKDVRYIEPKLEQTNVQVKNQYRNQILTSVGISFLSTDSGSYGASEISIKELMKMINRIGEQLGKVLKKWYLGLLKKYNISPEYCPDIKILDTELLEQNLRVELAAFLFEKMGASYESTYELLGRSIKNEVMRRKIENNNQYDEIFFPRVNAFTVSGSSSEDKGGRPESNKDINKQNYDNERNNISTLTGDENE